METCNKYDIMSGRRNSNAPKGASRTSTGSIFDNVYLDEAKRTETNQYLTDDLDLKVKFPGELLFRRTPKGEFGFEIQILPWLVCCLK